MSRLDSYWRTTRSPRYSLLFALPLLVAYEVSAAAISRQGEGIRNGADILLKSLFLGLGGARGLLAFSVLLLGTGVVLVVRDLRATGWRLEVRFFAWMFAESCVAAVAFGAVTSTLTGLLLSRLPHTAIAPMVQLDLATQLTVSLGAGIYEELLFRVLLVTALAAMAREWWHWVPGAAGVFATVVGALIFSAFHYIGPLGDRLELGSFTFRAVAGVLFSGLYLVRGFGVTAWTHAMYDVFVSIAA